MITFFVAAVVLVVTVRIFGARLMPMALAASAIGIAVNVLGVLPVPPTPLAAAAAEIRHYQEGQAKSLTCHLRAYDALSSEEDRVEVAYRACAAAQAHWESDDGVRLD